MNFVEAVERSEKLLFAEAGSLNAVILIYCTQNWICKKVSLN